MQDTTFWPEVTALLRAGSPSEALARFTPSLPPATPNALAYRLLGDALYKQRNPVDALIAYEEALQLHPTFATALFNAAVSHKALGAFEDAERLLKRADQVQPDNALVQKLLGEVCFLRGRFEESIVYYDAALALAPDTPNLRYRREKSVIARDGLLDDPATVFANIYAHNAWGNLQNNPQKFFSGVGSYAPATVETYVSAVTRFLGSLEGKPDAVDIGCGDFNIGSKIYPFCGRYTALDVVADLVAYNTERFADTGVQFAQLDITRQAPPVADVFFIREVFQHLSNAQIIQALKNMENRFKYLVFTEALPKGDFTLNVDKSSGESARVFANNSGIVLTAAPFNARFASDEVLCTVERADSIVVTRVYKAV